MFHCTIVTLPTPRPSTWPYCRVTISALRPHGCTAWQRRPVRVSPHALYGGTTLSLRERDRLCRWTREASIPAAFSPAETQDISGRVLPPPKGRMLLDDGHHLRIGTVRDKTNTGVGRYRLA